jgi:hypothetical protein
LCVLFSFYPAKKIALLLPDLADCPDCFVRQELAGLLN